MCFPRHPSNLKMKKTCTFAQIQVVAQPHLTPFSTAVL